MSLNEFKLLSFKACVEFLQGIAWMHNYEMYPPPPKKEINYTPQSYCIGIK